MWLMFVYTLGGIADPTPFHSGVPTWEHKEIFNNSSALISYAWLSSRKHEVEIFRKSMHACNHGWSLPAHIFFAIGELSPAILSLPRNAWYLLTNVSETRQGRLYQLLPCLSSIPTYRVHISGNLLTPVRYRANQCVAIGHICDGAQAQTRIEWLTKKQYWTSRAMFRAIHWNPQFHWLCLSSVTRFIEGEALRLRHICYEVEGKHWMNMGSCGCCIFHYVTEKLTLHWPLPWDKMAAGVL